MKKAKMKKIVYIIGTRPEIIRSVSVINLLRSDQEVELSLVHTGQHYDYEMSQVFFDELSLKAPDINLNIGSGSHAEQSAKIMIKLEKYFLKFKPNIVIVFGDTDSSLAAALTAVKLQIPVAHLEAGCREWEMDMPEEINRRLIDHCSELLLTVSRLSSENLKRENVAGDIYFVGDPLYEVFKKNSKKESLPKLHDCQGFFKNDFILATIHREKNVDIKDKLENIMESIGSIGNLNVLFPVHPRTKKRLDEFGLFAKYQNSNIFFTKPLKYKEIISVLRYAKLLITDSGGLQKEAFWSKIPCITIREHTAWEETVNLGVNFLCSASKDEIVKKVAFIINNYQKIKKKFSSISNPYKTSNTAYVIVQRIKQYLK